MIMRKDARHCVNGQWETKEQWVDDLIYSYWAQVLWHEFGHALVAYLGGDRMVVAQGYLSLNPLRYTNILLSVVMPIAFLLLGGIGLPGAAVYINHSAIV